MKKFIAILLATVLVLSLTVTVYAHDFPSKISDWTDDDWEAWDDYWDDYYSHHHREKDPYRHRDDWDRPPEDPYYNDWCNYQNYLNYNNYSNYNFYAGILDVYDGSTEDQATVLARIINIYAHGVASQTAQAAVGWAVMNSVDASGRGANVCTVAGNFNYDYNGNVTDDFGRNLLPLARDILLRWKAGRAGCGSNGRVLPSGYYYVTSTGGAVAFGSTPNEVRTVQSFGYTTPYGS